MKTNSSQVGSTSPEAMVIQLSLCLVLLATCLIGNGAICFMVMRFRTLKTVPNILLANLAAVDFFNTVVNLPPFVGYHVINDDLFNSSAGAWWITFLAFFFVLLNLISMFILVVDRFLAIVYAMRYNVWKSRSKALVAVTVAWMFALITSLIAAAPMYNIELGRKSVLYYQSTYAKRTNYRRLMIPIIAILVISIAIVTICTMREMSRRLRVSDVAVTLRKNNSKREETASRSTSTILMILLSFTLCQVFGFCLIILSTSVLDEHSRWFFFLGTCLFFFSSSINAFIYSYRSSRFRLALKEIFRSSICKRGFVFPSNRNSSEARRGRVFYIKGTFGKVQIQINTNEPVRSV